MPNLKEFPDTYGSFHEDLQALRKLVENSAPATEIGRAAALLHLDRISEILTYLNVFNATFGLETLMSYRGAEEDLPRINTTIRILGELTDLFLKQLNGFMNCFGGPPVIAAQALWEWAAGNPHREMYLSDYLAAAARRPRCSRR
ncbi:MAG TPA: hypothetical protein VMI10_23155 [Terriglobales bacterium]|nr:hypothetical protein [Terriglobales bacterium]